MPNLTANGICIQVPYGQWGYVSDVESDQRQFGSRTSRFNGPAVLIAVLIHKVSVNGWI